MIGPPSSERVDEVDGHAGDLDARRERVADGVCAGEGGQQRRVQVDDAAREGRQHRRAEDAHVAGQDDQLRGRGRDGLGEEAVLLGPPASSPRGAAGTSSVSIPCSTAQSRAAHARSAKTRAISASSAAAHDAPPRAGPAGCCRFPRRRPRSDVPRRSSSVSARRALPCDSGLRSRGRPRRTTTRRAARPSSSRLRIAASTAAAGTTQTMPRPPLNVERSSASESPPRAPIRRMTDGIGQCAG